MTSNSTPRSLAVFAVLFLLLPACGFSADDDISIVFDPCEPITLQPDPAANASQVESLHAAAALWNAHGTNITVDAKGAESGISVIPVEFEDAAPMFFGIYLDEVGDVVINDRISDDQKRTIVATHELGHAFGLEHVEKDAHSVMKSGNTDLAPTALDIDALHELWPSCGLSENAL